MSSLYGPSQPKTLDHISSPPRTAPACEHQEIIWAQQAGSKRSRRKLPSNYKLRISTFPMNFLFRV